MLYHRLMTAPNGTRTSVIVEGEFQSSKDEIYGVGCKTRIILHRVVSISDH